MKKWIAWILILMLAAVPAFTFAEQEEPFFARFDGMEWSFTSGVGGWSTDMRIRPDGTFAGEYHDSEMGETGNGYPDGTVYCCAFTGRMVLVEQPDESPLKVRVAELKTEPWEKREYIEDGIRFVFTEPYGLTAGDEMALYTPGTPVTELSEEMQLWAHLFDNEDTLYELDSWFLWSEKNSSGFLAWSVGVEETVLP